MKAPREQGIESAPPAPLGRLRRGLLIAAGVVAVGLALAGVFVPVLPTTPFLLLAAACFMRSSERLYRWLIGNRVFGKYIRRYREGSGIPLASKVATLALLWATLAASAFLGVPARLWWVRLLLLAVGIGVTIHIACIRTARRPGRAPAPGLPCARSTESRTEPSGTRRSTAQRRR